MHLISNEPKKVFGFLVAALSATLLLLLFSLWVPFSDGFYYEWLQGDLIREIQPRAFLGTIANLMHFGDSGFAVLKILSLWCWLSLIIWQLVKGMHGIYSPQRIYILFCISFVFAFSTVTQMSFGPVMFIDIVPYLLVLIVFLNLLQDKHNLFLISFSNAILLTVAVAIHEKSVFDIGILLVWVLYKKGFQKTTLYLGPGIFFCATFLYLSRGDRLTGESPVAYFSILQNGFDFLKNSFSLVEVIFGFGALGMLYLCLSYYFVKRSLSVSDGILRLLVATILFLGCVAPLLVAWDTNRLVGLIWLPALLLFIEVGDTFFLFPTNLKILFLSLLCAMQMAIPPILRYPPNFIIAYNSYSKLIYGTRAIQIQAPVRRGEVLSFKDKAKGASFLGVGWESPEVWGVWSNHVASIIQFDNLDQTATKATIHFNALVSKLRPSQTVLIYANDQFIGKVEANKFNNNIVQISLPKRGWRELKFRFEVEDLVSPVEIGISSDDNRKIGIGLTEIHFD